jgi:hypothetical protein
MPETSLDRATAAIGELSSSVRALHGEVVQSESLRTTKVRWIQRVLYIMVPAMALLVLLAITNFVLLARINATAEDASSTNTLLLGCFQPGSRCSQENQKTTAAVMNQIRQTQFAIALCQRLNPADRDPAGSGFVRCVQQYYPGFTLPPKTAPTPMPSTTQ